MAAAHAHDPLTILHVRSSTLPRWTQYIKFERDQRLGLRDTAQKQNKTWCLLRMRSKNKREFGTCSPMLFTHVYQIVAKSAENFWRNHSKRKSSSIVAHTKFIMRHDAICMTSYLLSLHTSGCYGQLLVIAKIISKTTRPIWPKFGMWGHCVVG